MSVLGNEELRRRITDDGLVAPANEGCVASCSYDFKPGVIFLKSHDGAGNKNSVVTHDWRETSPEPRAVQVPPGALFWMRTKETVRMPDDLCALWVQTNNLSRQGLMLVNTTLVPPGYAGPLSCLFTNFGDKHIALTPETTVARLAFLAVNEVDSVTQVNIADDAYSNSIAATAADTPMSFLDIDKVALTLRDELASAKLTLASEVAAAKDTIRDASAAARGDALDRFRTDSKSAVLRSLGWAGAGLILLVLATSFIPWVQDHVSPSINQNISTEVQKQLSEDGVPTADVRELTRISNEISSLQTRLKNLKGDDRSGGQP